jgi:hypothetical protein
MTGLFSKVNDDEHDGLTRRDAITDAGLAQFQVGLSR